MRTKLCALLLRFVNGNFHCWNYCLGDGFEIKTDLHNPAFMHFKPFQDRWLFIDSDDEGVWRAYEKRRSQITRGHIETIRRYKKESSSF